MAAWPVVVQVEKGLDRGESMLVAKVLETFDIEKRGLVVITDTSYEQLPRELRLKLGDSVQLRMGGIVVLESSVAGIEHCDPWTPKQLFGILLPGNVRKEDVPVGADVWVTK